MSLSKSKFLRIFLIVAGILLALVVRIYFFPFKTDDARIYLIPWYDHIVKHGFIPSLAENFYNYNPPYIYLIGLATYFPWIPKWTAIKLISVGFDFVAALAAFRMVALKRQDWAWPAFFTVLFLPTVFVESGIWGQCDIIYCAFLLWALYFLLKEGYRNALIFYSIAFVFKFQAIFLAPLFFLLLIQRKIRIHWLLYPLGIYLLSIAPVWLAGRPLMDILSIYISQSSTYPSLSMNAPNLFFLVTGDRRHLFIGVIIGMVITVVFVLAYLALRFKDSPGFKPELYLYDAALLAFFVPFLLPKMHERYFFLSALCFALLFFFEKMALWPAILLQISSLLSYAVYLYRLRMELTLVAMVINVALALWLVILYWKRIRSDAIKKGIV